MSSVLAQLEAELQAAREEARKAKEEVRTVKATNQLLETKVSDLEQQLNQALVISPSAQRPAVRAAIPSLAPSSLKQDDLLPFVSKGSFHILSNHTVLAARVHFETAKTAVLTTEQTKLLLELKQSSVCEETCVAPYTYVHPGNRSNGLREEHMTGPLSFFLRNALLHYFPSTLPSITALSMSSELEPASIESGFGIDSQVESKRAAVSSFFTFDKSDSAPGADEASNLDAKDLFCVHQFAIGTGNCDVQIGCVKRRDRCNSSSQAVEFLMMACLEVTRFFVADKYPQVLAYCMSSLLHQGFQAPVLAIRMNSMEFAVDVVYREFDPKVSNHQFVSIPFVAKQTMDLPHLHALCSLIVSWIKTFVPLCTRSVDCDNPRTAINFVPDATVLAHDGFIYKRFHPGSERSPLYFFTFLPETQYVLQCEDVTVIRYPRIAGIHRPSTVRHLVSLIDAVLKMHEQQIVHGDIRFANIVFSANLTSHLIDFDLSGKQSERQYPRNFSHTIGDDGLRHEGALPECLLEVEHDCFALIALMQKLKSEVSDSIRDYYGRLLADCPCTDDGLKYLKSSLESLLASAKADEVSIKVPPEARADLMRKGTGTPPKAAAQNQVRSSNHSGSVLPATKE